MSVLQTLCRRLAPLCLLMLSMIAHGASLPTGFAETRVATGLASPTAMTVAPDGRMFITQQGGALRVVKNGALLSQPFLTMSVDSSGERGLLGVAFDPNFATNSFVYVYYTTSASPVHNRVSRFTASARQSGRRRGRQRSAVAQPAEPELGDQPQRRRDSLRHRRQALHRGRRERQQRQLAVLDHYAGQDAAHQRRRLDPVGQSLRQPNYRHQPGDLGAWACAIRSLSRSIAPTAASISTTSARTRGKRLTWASPARTTAGRRPRVSTRRASRACVIRFTPTSMRGQFCAITGAAFYRPVTATFPSEYAGRYFFGDFCGGFIRTLSPPELFDRRGFRHGHRLAGGHRGSPGRFALLSGAWRRRTVPRAVHRQHRAEHLVAAREPHGGRRPVRELLA